MGGSASKAKQGEEKAEQKTDKGGKEAKDLLKFMEEKYDSKISNVKEFDEFYHAIYEMIEMFCEKHGQLQYKIPPKEEIEGAYKSAKARSGSNVSKEQFTNITKQLVGVDRFSFGKAAVDVLLVLFGAPACALFAKRFVPGLKSLSDDVVIPVATSGAVVYLAKTNKL